ncbi:MAG: ATP-grasp domain-containing protein [Planctomycetes bacterium]|nr:ATP-grasp domain-containing protein [Planctomycetota bacterium]
MNVTLLYDRLSPDAREDERDVLVQRDAIAAALQQLGHRSSAVDLSLNLDEARAALRRLGPDVVFNLVEAVEGKGRLIYLAPALLDAMKLPYTGAGTEAMFITSSKLLTKRMLATCGIATPAWLTLDLLRRESPRVAGRYIIKSVWEEASVGLDEDSILEVHDRRALRQAVERRLDRLGGEAFAEAYVEGREFNVSLLADGDGCTVLPLAEIRFDGYSADRPRIVGYRAKWVEDSFEYRNTRRCFDISEADSGLLAELRRISSECWTLLGLRGYARVDFRVDAAGKPWVLEVNANPCLSPDAGFAAAAEVAGMSYTDLIARILADACGG